MAVQLCGCASTKIEALTLPSELLSLSQSNGRKISIKVSDPANFSRISSGHQFLFPFFPIKNIRVPLLKQDLYNQLFSALTLRGFKVVAEQSGVPQISVEPRNFELSAYDLIATRRVRANLELYAEFRSTNQDLLGSASALDSVVEYRRFGFERELKFAYNKALTQAIDQLLARLNLGATTRVAAIFPIYPTSTIRREQL